MKPIDQTAFGDPDGNCWGAAIASLLEVPLAALPDYVTEAKEGRDWHGTMSAYLYKHHGLMLLRADGRLTQFVTPKSWHLISGMSPRGLSHAVVGHAGEMIHDPHPSRAGVLSVDEYEFLVPVNLDELEGDHRKAMEAWVSRRPCICTECLGEQERAA
jgi:hypothetical protein